VERKAAQEVARAEKAKRMDERVKDEAEEAVLRAKIEKDLAEKALYY